MLVVVDVPNGLGKGLVTTARLLAGEVVGSFADATARERPSRSTVQVAESLHLDDLNVCAHLNHSCDPNTVIDVERRIVRARRRVEPGEMLTFFYPATEWEMAEPFACGCGSPSCIGFVSGARDLPDEVLARYELSPHVARLRAAVIVS